MKKYFIYTLLLTLTLAITVISCKSDEEVVQPKKEALVFTGIIDESVTRTDIEISGNEGLVKWVEGDEIDINGVKYVAHPDETDPRIATFTLKAGEETEAVANESGKYVATYGDVNHQVRTSTSNNYAPMSAESETTTLNFTNSCGMLKLNIKGDKSISSIKVGEYTLTCDPVVALNTETGTDFYVALPADTYSNLKLVFTASDNTVCTKTANKDIQITENHIRRITLGTALVFKATPTVTYYNATGVIENPVEGTNTDFTITTTQGGTQFKHCFPSANHDEIDFDNGDVIEAKILIDETTQATSITNSNASVFTFGSNTAWGQVDGDRSINSVIYLNTSAGHNHNHLKFGVSYVQGDIGQAEIYDKNYIWMQVSKANGLRYSFDGSTWTLVVDKNNQYLAEILARGKSNEYPLYVGVYHQPMTITYKYLKVTRVPATPHDPIHVTGLTLDKNNATIYVNGSDLQINATITPNDADDKSIDWTSSNESVATVSNKGVVHAIAEGNTTITATTVDGGYIASCAITVSEDKDDPNIGDVFYISRMGKKHNTPQPFDISAGNGYEIAIPIGTGANDVINWSAGDMVEISIRAKGEDQGNIVIIGDKAKINGNVYDYYNIRMNVSGPGNETWWNIASHSDIQTMITGRAVDSSKKNNIDAIMRIKSGQISYYGNAYIGGVMQGENWYDVNITGNVATLLSNITNLSTLYIMTNSNENPIGHINYIKIVKSGASSTNADTGSSDAGGTIDNGSTTW